MKRHITIALEHSGVWRTSSGTRKRPRPKGEPGIVTRPVRLATTTGDVLARVTAFPLPDESVTSIACRDVLEFVRNDIGLLDEIARVLAPGGELLLRVPATGPLAGIDRLNLMHYLVDITHRGMRPNETYEVGWRRHYSVNDIEGMLSPNRFRIVSTIRRRLALAELTGFGVIALFRWLWPSHDRYRRCMRIVRRIERMETRIVTPFGSVMEVKAIRLPDPVISEESRTSRLLQGVKNLGAGNRVRKRK